MIRHIVWWRFKPLAEDRTAAQNALEIKSRGEALAGKIPGLLGMEITTAILPGSTVPARLVLSSTHETVEDLRHYAEHPLHLEVLELIRACTEDRQCLDYEVS